MKRSIKQFQKFIFWLIYIENIAILASGHSTPPEYDSFLNPGGHADYLSLHDIGFLNWMWLKVLAFVKVRTLLRVRSNTFS
jgi:hypothetical protein